MFKKRNFIFILLAILAFSACKKKYTFNQNWKFKTNTHTAGIHFEYKGNVYVSAGQYVAVGSPNHLIYCLDKNTGLIKWKYDVGTGVILHRIKLFKGKIFLEVTENNVTCLDALTGNKLENVSASNIPETVRNHTFNGNRVFAVAGNAAEKIPAKIVCKNASGKTLWTYDVKPIKNVKKPYAVNFSFLISGNKLILATYDGKIISYTVK